MLPAVVVFVPSCSSPGMMHFTTNQRKNNNNKKSACSLNNSFARSLTHSLSNSHLFVRSLFLSCNINSTKPPRIPFFIYNFFYKCLFFFQETASISAHLRKKTTTAWLVACNNFINLTITTRCAARPRVISQAGSRGSSPEDVTLVTRESYRTTSSRCWASRIKSSICKT